MTSPAGIMLGSVASTSPAARLHAGLSTKEHDLPAMFGDVKFFLTGGSAFRIRQLAAKVEAAGFGTSGARALSGL